MKAYGLPLNKETEWADDFGAVLFGLKTSMGRKSRNSRSRKARGASKTRQLFKGKARTATKEFLHYLITNPDD